MATEVGDETTPVKVSPGIPGAAPAPPATSPEGTFSGEDVPTPPRYGWRYRHDGVRDLRLDLLRGFAVFAMAVDHIGGASWLYAITGGNRFFVSAAEGFVFISGVTVGIVYSARARAGGLRAVVPKLLERAWLLYVLAVWLAIGTAFAAAVLRLPRGNLLAEAPAQFVFEVVTLQRTFYLVDVMLLYAFLLLFTPLALALLLRGWWWAVGLLSWGLWGTYQFTPDVLRLPWPIVDNPVFNLAPWQVLFFTGLLLGWGRDCIAAATARWPRSPLRDGWVVPLAVPVGALLWLHVTNGAALDAQAPGGSVAALLDAWFDKSALPPARLAACAVVFAFAWAFVNRFWYPLRKVCGPFLLLLGQGALYAYAAHLFLAVIVHAGMAWSWGSAEDGGFPRLHPGINAAVQLWALAVLWCLTRLRFLGSIVRPLGAPPLSRDPHVGAGKRFRFAWRPSDSLAAVLLLALVSGVGAVPGGPVAPAPAARSSGTGTMPSSSGAGEAAPPRRPVSTVIAPRQIGGPVARPPAAQATPVVAAPTPPRDPARAASDTPVPDVARSPSAAATPPVAGPAGTGPATSPPTAPRVDQAVGGYLRDGEFFSAALGRTMPYGIYLPPGYDAASRRYPVLYMLHGGGGHYSEWVEYGLPEGAEGMILDGRIGPLIIVLPQGDRSYWSNHADDNGVRGEAWGDYVAFDLVAHIDATYRTLPQPGGRAIGGLSMGGFGALQLALKYPDIFGAAGGHSPSLRTFEDRPDFLGDAEHFASLDPLELATRVAPAGAPRLWLDVGGEDRWTERVIDLHNILRRRGIRHEYHAASGGHDADYWNTHVPDYLRFYDAALRPR